MIYISRLYLGAPYKQTDTLHFSVTKASLAIATLYTLSLTGYIPITVPQALLICSAALVTTNLAMALAGLPDPFHPISKVTVTGVVCHVNEIK